MPETNRAHGCPARPNLEAVSYQTNSSVRTVDLFARSSKVFVGAINRDGRNVSHTAIC